MLHLNRILSCHCGLTEWARQGRISETVYIDSSFKSCGYFGTLGSRGGTRAPAAAQASLPEGPSSAKRLAGMWCGDSSRPDAAAPLANRSRREAVCLPAAELYQSSGGLRHINMATGHVMNIGREKH